MSKRKALALAALALTLTACSSDYTGPGVVKDKKHTPGFYSTVTVNKTTTTTWVPPTWKLDVCAMVPGEQGKPEERKCWWDKVEQHQYDQTEIGQRIEIEDGDVI